MLKIIFILLDVDICVLKTMTILIINSNKSWKFITDQKNTNNPKTLMFLSSCHGMSATHAVGCWFVPRPGHYKDHHKNGTNCLPVWHALG